MRLLSLELTDFRAFHGNCKLEFAADDTKRVTVFHGENGAGKTNLLNAIHWCVTGQFTPRFQDRQLLVNKVALQNGRRECSVELIFKDEEEGGGKIYRVRRSATNERTDIKTAGTRHHNVQQYNIISFMCTCHKRRFSVKGGIDMRKPLFTKHGDHHFHNGAFVVNDQYLDIVQSSSPQQ